MSDASISAVTRVQAPSCILVSSKNGMSAVPSEMGRGYRPALRLDLQFQQDSAGVIVIDPARGRRWMLHQVEYRAACEMDGRRDLSTLSHSLGMEISQLEQVVEKLAQMDLLLNSDTIGPIAPIIPLPIQRAPGLKARSEDFDDEVPTAQADVTTLEPTPFDDDDAYDGGTDIVPPTFLDDDPVFSSAPRVAAPRPATPLPTEPPAPPPVPSQPPQPQPPPPLPPAAAPVTLSQKPDWELEKPVWYKRKRIRRLIVLGVFVAIFLALTLIQYPLYVTEPCIIAPIDRAEVRSQVAGIIAEVFVRQGDNVEIGTPLVRIDDREVTYQLRQAQAEADRVQANLAKVKGGSRMEEIRRAQAVVAARAQDVKFAANEAKRQQKAFNDGVASAMVRDAARRDLEIKRAALAEAQAELRLIQAGSRSEEVTIAEAELRKVEAEIEFLKKQVDGLLVRSPIAGQVLTPRFHEQLHKRVNPGDMVCEVGNEETVRVDIQVPEGEADVIRVGHPVEVKVKSFPLESFNGRVSHIAPAVEEIEGQRVIVVETVLENPERKLRPRMTGFAEIDTGDRPLGVRVFRRALRWLRVRFLL
jgi:HlyD family secretion protein